MSNFPEMPCNTIRNINGKAYRKKIFGCNGVVYEEHLIPIPINKKVITYKDDGTIDKEESIPIEKIIM